MIHRLGELILQRLNARGLCARGMLFRFIIYLVIRAICHNWTFFMYTFVLNRKLDILIYKYEMKHWSKERVCCFYCAFNNFSVISRRSMDVNRIYSAATLKCHAPHTWHDTPPGHIILKPSWPVLALLLMLIKRNVLMVLTYWWEISLLQVEGLIVSDNSFPVCKLSARTKCPRVNYSSAATVFLGIRVRKRFTRIFVPGEENTRKFKYSDQSGAHIARDSSGV